VISHCANNGRPNTIPYSNHKAKEQVTTLEASENSNYSNRRSHYHYDFIQQLQSKKQESQSARFLHESERLLRSMANLSHGTMAVSIFGNLIFAILIFLHIVCGGAVTSSSAGGSATVTTSGGGPSGPGPIFYTANSVIFPVIFFAVRCLSIMGQMMMGNVLGVVEKIIKEWGEHVQGQVQGVSNLNAFSHSQHPSELLEQGQRNTPQRGENKSEVTEQSEHKFQVEQSDVWPKEQESLLADKLEQIPIKSPQHLNNKKSKKPLLPPDLHKKFLLPPDLHKKFSCGFYMSLCFGIIVMIATIIGLVVYTCRMHFSPTPWLEQKSLNTFIHGFFPGVIIPMLSMATDGVTYTEWNKLRELHDRK